MDTSKQQEQTPPNKPDISTGVVDDDAIPIAVLAADSHLNPDYRLLSLEKRRTSDSDVFPMDQESLSPLPRPNHWSIAWSDLMMTMFVLFFVLFVHEAKDSKQLNEEKLEILASKAIQQPVRTIFLRESIPVVHSQKKLDQKKSLTVPVPEKEKPPQPVVLNPRSDTPVRHPLMAPTYTAPGAPKRIPGSVGEVVEVIDNQDTIEKNRQKKQEAENTPYPSFKEVYDKGQQLVQQRQLQNFAAIDIVPNKTVRVTLTGDLLFPSAQATLTPQAQKRLRMLAKIIAHTPYRVNIEGHTDNLPIISSKFPDNWALSLARANSVARFLIDAGGLDPRQLVVSGHSSYKPAADNTTKTGRAKNRRVEIILSQPEKEEKGEQPAI